MSTRTRLLLVSAALLALPAAAFGIAATAAEPGPRSGPTPRATDCAPGDPVETGMQGRIPPADIASGRAARGYRCNATEIGHLPSLAGWRVHRFGDCAYYNGDPGGLPLGLINVNPRNPGEVVPLGVHVVDMSDPRRPVQTDFLRTPVMASPHESMSLHQGRGLLVAVLGNLGSAPGVLEVWDVKTDCRKPRLLNTLVDGVPLAGNVEAVLGHEGELSADGRTYYAGSAGGGTLTAVDLSDPRRPRFLATDTSIPSHGISTSADGRLLYSALTSGPEAGLVIYDVSSIQGRTSRPRFERVGRTTWPEISIPQGTIPVTIGGRSLLVESDEFGGTTGTAPAGGPGIGAARLIDVSDPARPEVVSNLRLEVHEPQNQAALAQDTLPLIAGPYTGHYCSVPQAVDPGIVACSMLRSGLRVFDVRDPERPREVAYFSPPASQNTLDGLLRGRGDPLQPVRAGLHVGGTVAFVPERREIWVSGQETGLHVIRLAPSAWPTARGAAPARPAADPTASPSDPAGPTGAGPTGAGPTPGPAPVEAAGGGDGDGGSLAATGPVAALGLLALLSTSAGAALTRRLRSSR